jgi:hypothetical protein
MDKSEKFAHRARRPEATNSGEYHDGTINDGLEGTIKMRCKTIAKLFVVSLIILAGSPALATQIARHDAHCRSSE